MLRDDGRVDSVMELAELSSKMTTFVLALAHAALSDFDDEANAIRLRPEDLEAVSDKVLIHKHMDDGGVLLSVVDRYVPDERVTPGGWLHAPTATAIRVLGVTRDDYVRFLVLVGTPAEHLHELPVPDFLEDHVRVDDVPFLGGVA